MKSTRKNVLSNSQKVRRLTEIAIMLALSTVLSFVKLYQLPYGGAFTLASMFPLIIIAYRHGTAAGFFAGLIYGVIQQLFSLSYIQGMTLFSAVMVIILDYGLAFAVIGFAGLFRKSKNGQVFGLVTGAVLGCFLRYACHTVAGCTVWAGVSVPEAAAFVYSLLYNAAYMIPETLITVAAAYYIGSCIDFNKEMPQRVASGKGNIPVSPLDITGGLCLFAAAVTDIIIVFSHTQNENGEFDIALIKDISCGEIITIAAVTLAAVVAFVVFRIVSSRKTKE